MKIDQTWFTPLDEQRDFIRYWDGDVAYVGGIGSGKTLSGAVKGLAASLHWPGTVGLVGRQTYRALKDTTQKVYLDGDDKPPVIPPELVRERSAQDNRVVLVNGSEILFRSFQDFNVEKLQSLNLGWFHIDEATETTERVWLTLRGRLRRPIGPRIGWATSNPNGHDWAWRRFHWDSPEATARLIWAPTEANAKNLAADYIETLRRDMPREWVKRYVDASFDTAAGAIWEEWDRSAHVIPPFEIPDSWPRFESLDHGRRNPTAVLWWTVSPDAELVVYDGYYNPGLVATHATAIKKIRDPMRRWGAIVSDPSVFVRGFDGRCVADEYAEHGVQLTRASNDVSAGLNRVSEWLTCSPLDVFPEWHPRAGEAGAPRVYVFDVPGTSDLRREIPDYQWKNLSPALEARADQPEEPLKKNDHACDAFRYGVMTRPRPRGPIETRSDPEAERDRAAISAGIVERVF